MAWKAPMTAAPNTIFTAPDFNTYIRNNLRETAPGLAEEAGQYFVSGAPNALIARKMMSHTVATSQTTTSLSFVDLSTVGPTVTVTTGSMAIAWWSTTLDNSSTDATSSASVKVSGKSNIPASTPAPLSRDGRPNGNPVRAMGYRHFVNLTPGDNIFTLQYRVGTGGTTGTFSDRHLVVMTLT